MSNSPRISVVMPVFNAVRYVSMAIDSVLGQSMGDFEFLIFDDGSTDGSIEVLQRYVLADARVKLHLGDHAGYSRWLNAGIAKACGDYVARMDADDICMPDRFVLQFRELEKNRDVTAVGGQVCYIDEDGDPICSYQLPITHEQIDREHLAGRPGMLVHPAAMIRRESLLKIGMYRAEFEPAEDLDLWLRLAEIGRLANIPDRVLYYRQHSRSVSRIKDEKQSAMARCAISDAFARRGFPAREVVLQEAPSEIGRLQQYASLARTYGYWKTSRKYARRQFLKNPVGTNGLLCLARSYSGRPGAYFERVLRRLTSTH